MVHFTLVQLFKVSYLQEVVNMKFIFLAHKNNYFKFANVLRPMAPQTHPHMGMRR